MEWQRHESLPSMSHFYGVLEFEMHFTIFLTDELILMTRKELDHNGQLDSVPCSQERLLSSNKIEETETNDF